MDKSESVSSPQDQPTPETEGRIVRSTRKLGDPPTPEMPERLARLKDIRDEDIDYSDIPPLPEGGHWVRAHELGFAWAQPRPGQRPSRKKDAA